MLVSGGFFDPENLQKELVELEEQLQNPDVWKDHKKLNSLNKEKTAFQSKLDEFNALESKFTDIKDIIEISIELNDEEELQKQEAIGFSMFKNNVMYLFLTLFLAFWLIPTFTDDDKIRYAVSVASPACMMAYLASYY